MIEIKTEIVVSYETIIDFSSVGRSLMNKYSPFADQRKLENTNNPDERVILLFGDERYFIDCTWERIAFIAQGSRSSFRQKNGKTRFYFDLMKRISNRDEFTEFKQLKLRCFDVLESGDDSLVSPHEFGRKFLADDITTRLGDFEDASLLLESSRGAFRIGHEFGPYRPQSDIGKHDLLAFKSPEMALWGDLQDASGLLSKLDITYSGVDIDFDTFIEADEIRFELAKQLESDLES